MSIAISRLIWEKAPYAGGKLLVLLALADWSNDDGVCWPSIRTIADKTRLERRSVQYNIRQLKKDGMIEIEEKRGRGHTHRFRLNAQELRLLPSRSPHQEKVQPVSPILEIKGEISSTEKAQLMAQKMKSTTEKVQPRAPDPLEEPLVELSKEPSPHSRLMRYHATSIVGSIPDPRAQAAAIKWLLDEGHDLADLERCYASLREDKWRSKVSWLTVKSEIGEWLAKRAVDPAKWNGNVYHTTASGPLPKVTEAEMEQIRRLSNG